MNFVFLNSYGFSGFAPAFLACAGQAQRFFVRMLQTFFLFLKAINLRAVVKCEDVFHGNIFK
jgi:hypothetical protein